MYGRILFNTEMPVMGAKAIQFVNEYFTGQSRAAQLHYNLQLFRGIRRMDYNNK